MREAVGAAAQDMQGSARWELGQGLFCCRRADRIGVSPGSDMSMLSARNRDRRGERQKLVAAGKRSTDCA